MEKHERLRQARASAGFSSAAEAARRLGVSYGTYSGHENGSRGIKDRELIRYAKVFNVSPSYLIFGEEDINYENNMVTTMGFAGHLIDGEVELLGNDDHEGAMYLPGLLPPNAGYFKVVGNYLRGIAEQGWLIFSEAAGSPPTDIYYGQLCICRTLDERYLCRTLHPAAAAGYFDLESPLYPLIRNIEIHSVFAVYLIATKIMTDEIYKRNRISLEAMEFHNNKLAKAASK